MNNDPTDSKINNILQSSDAWQANKQEIPKPPIQYPEEAKKLLNATQDSYGLNERLKLFFSEFYHPFPDIKTVTSEFRKLALQDSWYFHKFPDATENLKLIACFGVELLKREADLHYKERILWALISFLQKEITEDYFKQDEIFEILNDLKEILQNNQILSARSSGKFVRFFFDTNQQKVTDNIKQLALKTLNDSFEIWINSSNKWLKNYKHLKQISIIQDYFNKIKVDFNKIKENQDKIQKNPDFDKIYRGLMKEVRQDMQLLDKTELLLGLFDLYPISFYQQEILNYLTLILRQAPISQNTETASDLFKILFPFFNRLGNKHYVVINAILEHLGKQIIPTASAETINLFCENILGIEFPDPNLQGINEDWQVLRNPAHLPTIRTYLNIIKIAPKKTSLLLAGLHVNLRAGGVFISDTDLFQSDVSDLLNSNIQPVYKQVKQLCRLFPVFFNEIGAEGDLRISSTKIDELNYRKDKLVHFFRKQIHIESNNTQIEFVEKILQTWYDGNIKRLKNIVPQDVWTFLQNDNTYIKSAKKTIDILMNLHNISKPLELLKTDENQLISESEEGNLDIRVAHLVKLHKLLSAKYNLDSKGAKKALENLRLLPSEKINLLFDYIDQNLHKEAVDVALEIMRELKKVILNPQKSEREEQIYRKRHIAAGIPSMYGRYKEKKLECLGASYRIEKLITQLLTLLIEKVDLDYITRPALMQIHWILKKFIEALELDGITVHELRSHLFMLGAAVHKEGFSVGQYLNIFQVISQRVQGIIKRYFYDFHTDAINITGSVRCKKQENECIEKISEKLMREIISSAFGVGMLDAFLGRILGTLADMRMKLDNEAVNLLLSFNADKAVVNLQNVPKDMANAVWLGNKGFNLHLLKSFNVKVPYGFVVSTEVYRCRKAMLAYPQMRIALRRRFISEIHRLEELSGLKLGKCGINKPPLLLSVRSGAAVSMPGVMMTFLNIGMNEKLAYQLSNLPNYAWTAWDCYRRMIQLWGMAYGIERDAFDEIINDMKQKHGVIKKLDLSPANMASLSKSYIELLKNHQVFIPENPMEQVMEAIDLVFKSWDSPMAEVYREQFDLASEWGTAVLVQRMILGNLNFDSGTGVAMTKTQNNEISLYGDFVPNSQGEDVVSGLVYPHPINEENKIERNETMSLQKDYPMHYKTLLEIARKLVLENDFPEQEIEFTFEDSNPDNLFVLQCRTLVSGHTDTVPVFEDTESEAARLSQGVGTGGGAYSGRAVFNRDGIKRLKTEHKNPDLILIRPDTVPDDVDMIFECNGLLTARGGITSHAAVTANRLGKVCVVNCRDLIVNEDKNEAKIGDFIVKEGTFLSLDGRTGLIYAGKRKVSSTSRSTKIVTLA